MNKELWKPIEGYEGFYEISNKGRVKSLSRIFTRKDGRRYTVKEKIINPTADKDGYLRIELNKIGTPKKHFIHRLVGIAFIDNPKGKPQINHVDFDTKNNNVENLEWVSIQENIDHNVKNHRLKNQNGINNPNIKINEETVLLIRKLRKQNKTIEEIADISKTTPSNVRNIVYNYTWKWLKEEKETVYE